MNNTTQNLPNSLIEAIRYFDEADRCFDFVKGLRWAVGPVVCPRCDHNETSFLTTSKAR
jgi:hypothetical protein